jgi:hypothetical protein
VTFVLAPNLPRHLAWLIPRKRRHFASIEAIRIVIGDDCLIGDLVAIFDSDFHPMEPSRPTRIAPVRIGANIWVGRSSTIYGSTNATNSNSGYL